MVYIPANQTKLYHDRKEPHLSTYEHYYDQPTAQERPMDRTHSKLSTFAKLYPRSEYYLRNRTLDKTPRSATDKTVELFPTPPSLNFSGNMPGGETAMQTYRGNGTFELLNGLTYSWRSPKPVRLLPYKDLTFKSEYQDEYCKNKKPYPGYSVLRRSTHL